jgi:hypothetical protein
VSGALLIGASCLCPQSILSLGCLSFSDGLKCCAPATAQRSQGVRGRRSSRKLHAGGRAEPGCHSGRLQVCSLPGSLSWRLLQHSSRCRDCQWIVPCFGSCEAFNCVSTSWRAASANVRNSRSQISLLGRVFTYATLVLTSVRGLLRGSTADRANDGLADD